MKTQRADNVARHAPRQATLGDFLDLNRFDALRNDNIDQPSASPAVSGTTNATPLSPAPPTVSMPWTTTAPPLAPAPTAVSEVSAVRRGRSPIRRNEPPTRREQREVSDGDGEVMTADGAVSDGDDDDGISATWDLNDKRRFACSGIFATEEDWIAKQKRDAERDNRDMPKLVDADDRLPKNSIQD